MRYHQFEALYEANRFSKRRYLPASTQGEPRQRSAAGVLAGNQLHDQPQPGPEQPSRPTARAPDLLGVPGAVQAGQGRAHTRSLHLRLRQPGWPRRAALRLPSPAVPGPVLPAPPLVAAPDKRAGARPRPHGPERSAAAPRRPRPGPGPSRAGAPRRSPSPWWKRPRPWRTFCVLLSPPGAECCARQCPERGRETRRRLTRLPG